MGTDPKAGKGESLESRLSRLSWRVVPGGAKMQTMHPLDRDLFREDMVLHFGGKHTRVQRPDGTFASTEPRKQPRVTSFEHYRCF